MLTFILRRLLLAVPVLLGVVSWSCSRSISCPATRSPSCSASTPPRTPSPGCASTSPGQAVPRSLPRLRRPARSRDLGRSIQQNRPVGAELADAWPATLELTVAALLLAAAVGIAAGVASAVWPNSLFDAVARLGSLFGLSMPSSGRASC